MGFKKAVDKILPGAYEDGLQALEKKDQDRIGCRKPRQILAGSVNLDKAMKPVDPDGNRWDYGIGVKRQGGEEVVWVEVHGAVTSKVQEVIDKLAWLKKWLREKAPALRQMTAKKDGYVWVASGKVAILRGSRQARLLESAGLKLPREHLRIE